MQQSNRSIKPIPGLSYTLAVDEHCRPIQHIDGKSDVVMWIHGFTGSPDDFSDFMKPYATCFDSVAPLLPGHGTHPSLLSQLSFKELFIPIPALYQYLVRLYRHVHVVGLSYGAILATRLALLHPIKSLTLLAPAFFLDSVSERKMKWVKSLRLYRFKTSVRKVGSYRSPYPLKPNRAYRVVPLFPASQLHHQSWLMRGQLDQIKCPVYHAHGDRDDTTPQAANHDLLRAKIKRYHYDPIKDAPHILTLSLQWHELAKRHLGWLKEHND